MQVRIASRLSGAAVRTDRSKAATKRSFWARIRSSSVSIWRLLSDEVETTSEDRPEAAR
jgi:hypothetical protein